MTEISPHDWFRPKLMALVAEADEAGIGRDVSVAVITDLINAPPFIDGTLKVEEGWNQDIGEPDGAVNGNAPATSEPMFNDGPHFAHVSTRRGGGRFA